MIQRAILAAVLSVGAVVGGAGCGSSSEPSNPDARIEIERALRVGLTEKDPALCQGVATGRFLEQNFGEGDADPLQQCRFQSVLPGEPFAGDVEFRSVDVDGDRAVATVSLSGGQGDGSVLRVELLRVGGRWKLDHYADIQIDRERFDAAARAALVGLRMGISEEEADCAVQRLRRIYDTRELERAFIAGKTQGFAAAQALCMRRRSLVRILTVGIRKAVPKGVAKAAADCLSRKITREASTDLLRSLFTATDELAAYFERIANEAAKECTGEAEAGLLPEPSPS